MESNYSLLKVMHFAFPLHTKKCYNESMYNFFYIRDDIFSLTKRQNKSKSLLKATLYDVNKVYIVGSAVVVHF